MSEYVPTTERVREQYTREQPAAGWTVAERGVWFDRWLAAHDTQVKAEALRVASAQCSNVAFGSNADVAEWLLDRADRIEQMGADQ